MSAPRRELAEVWVGPLSLNALKSGVKCSGIRLLERDDGTYDLIVNTSMQKAAEAGMRGVFVHYEETLGTTNLIGRLT